MPPDASYVHLLGPELLTWNLLEAGGGDVPSQVPWFCFSPDQVSLLKLRLRKEALAAGDGVSRLFLRAQAVLFGGYRDALICRPVSSHLDAPGPKGEQMRLLKVGEQNRVADASAVGWA